jgi:hypothetical protein
VERDLGVAVEWEPWHQQHLLVGVASSSVARCLHVGDLEASLSVLLVPLLPCVNPTGPILLYFQRVHHDGCRVPM